MSPDGKAVLPTGSQGGVGSLPSARYGAKYGTRRWSRRSRRSRRWRRRCGGGKWAASSAGADLDV